MLRVSSVESRLGPDGCDALAPLSLYESALVENLDAPDFLRPYKSFTLLRSFMNSLGFFIYFESILIGFETLD